MLRKVRIVLFATAAVGLLAPDVASARGGGGFGGGGGRGGGGFGGGHGVGGFAGGGGFHGAAIGGGGFRGAAISGGAFRGASIGGGTFRAAAIGGATGFRTAATPGMAGRAAFWGSGFRGGFRHHGFHRRFFPVFVGAGLGNYGYYDDYYPYDYGYYDYPYAGYGEGYSETGCYIVRQRVHTPHGWRLRRVQVCS